MVATPPFAVPYTSCGRKLADCTSWAEIPTSAHPHPNTYGGMWKVCVYHNEAYNGGHVNRACGDVQSWKSDGYIYPYWLWLCGDCCRRNGLLW